MTIIAFAHHKGGTGKTTSCINIAGHLANAGKWVLVIDMDPQGNATSGLGIDKETLEHSMYEVMLNEMKIKEIIIETECGVHLAPATLDLLGAEPYMYERERGACILREAVEEIKDHYDYILIDTPPGPGLFLINGIVAADHTIVVLDPGIFALEGMETLFALFDDIKEEVGVDVNIKMLILTKYYDSILLPILRLMPSYRDPAKEIEEGIRTFLEVKGINGDVFTVPHSKKIYEAQLKGLPISYCAPKSEVCISYKNITEAIIKNGKRK